MKIRFQVDTKNGFKLKNAIIDWILSRRMSANQWKAFICGWKSISDSLDNRVLYEILASILNKHLISNPILNICSDETKNK